MQAHHEGVAWVRGAEPLSAFDVIAEGPRRVIVRVLGGRLAVSVHRPGTFRVRWLVDEPAPDYGILTEDGDRPHEDGDAVVEQGEDEGGAWLRVRRGDVALVLRARPFRIELERAGEVLLGPAQDRSIDGDLRFPAVARKDGGWLLSFELPTGERVHGLGEKWAALDRRGQRVRSWNEDATNLSAEISYKNTPFAWSPAGWWWFLHTPAPVTHGVGYPNWSHRTLLVHLEDPELDLFVGAHYGPADAPERYTDLPARTILHPV